MGARGWGCLALFACPAVIVIVWMIASVRSRQRKKLYTVDLNRLTPDDRRRWEEYDGLVRAGRRLTEEQMADVDRWLRPSG